MASKQSNDKPKTSKTARVMNLLSKKQDAAEEAPEASAAAPVPPILSSIGSDAAVSGQIKNALEDALDNDLSPAPQPESDSVLADIFAPLAPPEVSAPVQTAEPDLQPAPVPAPPPAPSPASTAAASDQGAGYVNVMQVLVEEKAPKYAKLSGICDCPRCMEDIKALALNHLPPKYVVMDQGDMIPKLTFYEGKYSSDITAQLLQACKIVGQTPHHNR